MTKLELKVPPLVVALLVGGGMWLASLATPSLNIVSPHRLWIAPALALAGISLIGWAGALFKRSHTTANPMNPGDTNRLVTSGVFRFSRNPMYLGGLLILLGWGVALGSPIALILSGAFVLYMNRFQIGPEERTLLAFLGEEYREYMHRVRRWI